MLPTHLSNHPDGQLQIVQNGEIGSIVNYSKQYIYAEVDVPVLENTSLDHMCAVVAAIEQQLKDDFLNQHEAIAPVFSD